ncbi:hypothetical protein [Bradyrhizobium sp. Ai1a-2]|uniref:hypothetical protein n=1 Tax=Bradyrhizobium sp. Ai1a-2 TaxID=196490 RepID=UPI0012686A6B|nr:hypothetical protein [Bradyrhizobium sp. Ai1a-2]
MLARHNSTSPRANDEPITEARIKRALLVVARVISECDRPEYGPLLERLERELQMFMEGRDPVSRARAILAEHSDKAAAQEPENETT